MELFPTLGGGDGGGAILCVGGTMVSMLSTAKLVRLLSPSAAADHLWSKG